LQFQGKAVKLGLGLINEEKMRTKISKEDLEILKRSYAQLLLNSNKFCSILKSNKQTSTEKVEEIEKKLSTYFKLKSDLENQKKTLETNLKNIETRIDNINIGYNRTNKIYQDLVNKASDLGIDYPKNIDVSFKMIEDLLKYTKSISTKNVKLISLLFCLMHKLLNQNQFC
jgi:chromosome segregation ATPase